MIRRARMDKLTLAENTDDPRALSPDLTASKTISDPVHGHMTIHPLCVAVIDTPQFQRLRYIRQVGFLDYVFPGATHTRFCHSIGVAYLAGRFLQTLRDQQPYLSICEKDMLCVQIAGLCHDLGHGPFSHTWEKFMKKQKHVGDHQTFKHDEVSVNMLEYLITKNELRKTFSEWGIREEEIAKIKAMILGRKEEETDKHFLFQIINNDDSGLDVDKWDYYLRDCYYLGLPCKFDYERLMRLARVIPVCGKQQICFRDKELSHIFEMFRIRSELHRVAYQHKFSAVVEHLFLDIVAKIDGKSIAPNGEVYNFVEWSNSAAIVWSEQESWELFSCRMSRFELLTDLNLLAAIQCCPSHNLCVEEQFALIHNRNSLKKAFKVIGEAHISQHIYSEQEICKQLLDHQSAAKDMISQYTFDDSLTSEDLIIDVVVIHWGKEEINPLSAIYFYSKNQPNHAFSLDKQHQIDINFPSSFQKMKIRVIGKYLKDHQLELLRKCFELYCKQNLYVFT